MLFLEILNFYWGYNNAFQFFFFLCFRFRLLLGRKQYFGFSDIGASKVQWYAFHKEEAGGTDPENGECLQLSFHALLVKLTLSRRKL